MRYAYCQFCDDLRFEIGNKMSMVGVYAGEMQIAPAPQPGMPVAIPKLCVVAYFDTGVKEPIGSLSVKISTGGRVLQEAHLPEEHLANLQAEATRGGTEEEPIEVVSIGANIVLSPFLIEDLSTLKVTVIADGVEYLAGKLRIRAAPLPLPI